MYPAQCLRAKGAQENRVRRLQLDSKQIDDRPDQLKTIDTARTLEHVQFRGVAGASGGGRIWSWACVIKFAYGHPDYVRYIEGTDVLTLGYQYVDETAQRGRRFCRFSKSRNKASDSARTVLGQRNANNRREGRRGS